MNSKEIHQIFLQASITIDWYLVDKNDVELVSVFVIVVELVYQLDYVSY
jgi:hypothetical protein